MDNIVKYTVVYQITDIQNQMCGTRTFERYDTLEHALGRAKVLAEEHSNVYVTEETYHSDRQLLRGSFIESLVQWSSSRQ